MSFKHGPSYSLEGIIDTDIAGHSIICLMHFPFKIQDGDALLLFVANPEGILSAAEKDTTIHTLLVAIAHPFARTAPEMLP